MLGLTWRTGRPRQALNCICRHLASDSKESPAQMDRRLADEQERKDQLNHYSMFELLRPASSSTVEYMSRLNAMTFTKEATISFLENKMHEDRVLRQRFLEERHQALGFDLAAAHFVVARGGRVRFKDEQHWVHQAEDGSVPLPAHYTHGMYVEELDASGTHIVYEGLENFIKLTKLRALYLRDCSFVDDWCVDRVCGEYRNQLRHLDLSGCTGVTASGLEGISQLRELRCLTLERMDHIRILPYICLLLEDALPNLEIRGVDVLQPPPDQSPDESSAVGQSPPEQSAVGQSPPKQSAVGQSPPKQSAVGQSPPTRSATGQSPSKTLITQGKNNQLPPSSAAS